MSTRNVPKAFNVNAADIKNTLIMNAINNINVFVLTNTDDGLVTITNTVLNTQIKLTTDNRVQNLNTTLKQFNLNISDFDNLREGMLFDELVRLIINKNDVMGEFANKINLFRAFLNNADVCLRVHKQKLLLDDLDDVGDDRVDNPIGAIKNTVHADFAGSTGIDDARYDNRGFVESIRHGRRLDVEPVEIRPEVPPAGVDDVELVEDDGVHAAEVRPDVDAAVDEVHAEEEQADAENTEEEEEEEDRSEEGVNTESDVVEDEKDGSGNEHKKEESEGDDKSDASKASEDEGVVNEPVDEHGSAAAPSDVTQYESDSEQQLEMKPPAPGKTSKTQPSNIDDDYDYSYEDPPKKPGAPAQKQSPKVIVNDYYSDGNEQRDVSQDQSLNEEQDDLADILQEPSATTIIFYECPFYAELDRPPVEKSSDDDYVVENVTEVQAQEEEAVPEPERPEEEEIVEDEIINSALNSADGLQVDDEPFTEEEENPLTKDLNNTLPHPINLNQGAHVMDIPSDDDVY